MYQLKGTVVDFKNDYVYLSFSFDLLFIHCNVLFWFLIFYRYWDKVIPLPEYTKNILEKFHKVVLTPSSYLSSSFFPLFLSFLLSFSPFPPFSISSSLSIIFLSIISGEGAEDLQSQSTIQQYLQEEQW